MVTLKNGKCYLVGGNTLVEATGEAKNEVKAKYGLTVDDEQARKATISYGILSNHNTSGDPDKLKIKFDAMASHDITYVGIIQTARASGLKEFPIPYVLTNCHNSLCAVGGTINEDDHMFGISAVKKYGGIYVPAHIAVIHQYMRECMSGCGKMILGSDSHTRYGALGTMAIGEGGPELVKQLLGRTYDIKRPEVVCVFLDGEPRHGIGPQDVALAIIGAVFKSGFVKNKVLEFVGPGVEKLPIEFRIGIDVMTTETTCLSSIWKTDGATKKYFETVGRPEEFSELNPGEVALYDSAVCVDLSKVESMIALPFHPSNTYTVKELLASPKEILSEVEENAKKQFSDPKLDLGLCEKIDSRGIKVSQGVIAGCAGGTYDNLIAASEVLDGKNIGADEFALSVYPASQPVYIDLIRKGAVTKLMESGATVRTAFCGPCFGAGDVPANKGLSIRHSTRNFPNREGSKPGEGQVASVALMDARSIAATAANGGYLTPATEVDYNDTIPEYSFDSKVYDARVYKGFGKADKDAPLTFGPNITDWPKMSALTDDLLLKVASVITDPVTTTDELIPSGETSSYRSNPEKLSGFALSRKDPEYVGRAKAVRVAEKARIEGKSAVTALPELETVINAASDIKKLSAENVGIGSVIFAVKPGDGSAREQAASCQKVLGGWANLAVEYATKRYRSNLINWGMLPLLVEKNEFEIGDWILLPDVRSAVADKADTVKAVIIRDGKIYKELALTLGELTDDERDIILSGCLINYYNK